MVLARLLLPSEMGQVALLGIIYGFTQFLGTLGLNHASPLVIPQYESDQRLDLIRSYVKRGIVLVLISSAALMLTLALISPFILSEGYVSIPILSVLILIIPFSALDAFLDSILLARYKIKRLASGRMAFDSFRIVTTIGLVWFGFNVIGVAWGWLVAEMVAVVIFVRASLAALDSNSVGVDMRPILSFALPSLLFQTIDVTIQNTDRLILLSYNGLTALGVYDVILGLLFMMSFVSIAVATSLYPILTKIYYDSSRAEDQKASLNYSVSILSRYVFLILIPISVFVSINSSRILFILFGSAYATFPNASLSFSLLVIAYSLWGLTYALHVVIRTHSEARCFIITGLSVFLLELTLCIYLTSTLGLLGAALVRCIYIFFLFLTALIWLKRNGIIWLSSRVVSIAKILAASLPSSILLYLLSPTDLIELIGFGFISILLYIGLLFVIREVDSLDFKIARSLLPMRLHNILTRIEGAYLRDTPTDSRV